MRVVRNLRTGEERELSNTKARALVRESNGEWVRLGIQGKPVSAKPAKPVEATALKAAVLNCQPKRNWFARLFRQ